MAAAAAEEEVSNRPAKEARSSSSVRTTVTEQNIQQLNSLQTRSLPPNSSQAAQQSNSLPSTPYVGARDFSGQFRTPSPVNGIVQPLSPRTVRSESDTTMRPPGRASLAGCKYETGIMHFKRRMPYSLGPDKLESSPTKVKKHLEPEEEKKLAGNMRELYDRLQPTEESEEKRIRFVKKLDAILNEKWPGNDIQVHVFGSSGNSLFTNDSDGIVNRIETWDECSLWLSRYLHNHKLRCTSENLFAS